jgi:protein-disulfide isomerase
MNNKIISIFLFLGILVMVFFGINLMSNKQDGSSEFDFSGISRPIKYEESPYYGAQNPELIIYEYADFECSYCKQMSPILDEVVEKYKGRVGVIWKDFPIVSENSIQLAIEARCAGEQGKFWEYHDKLFGELAKSPDIEEGLFNACVVDENIATLVDRDYQEGLALGVESTPTFVIGDVGIVGAVTKEELEKTVLNALSTLGE